MQAYRIETVLPQDGKLTLSNLPLPAGSTVEVIILVQAPASRRSSIYPLRGKHITYLNPTEPIAQTDWEVLK